MPRINRPSATNRTQNVRDIQNANPTAGAGGANQADVSGAPAPDTLDANASSASMQDLRPAHDGSVNLGNTAALGGHGLVAPGDAQQVVNKSLARSLRVTLRACEKHFDYAGEFRRPDTQHAPQVERQDEPRCRWQLHPIARPQRIAGKCLQGSRDGRSECPTQTMVLSSDPLKSPFNNYLRASNQS
jgi:hypothetical protein